MKHSKQWSYLLGVLCGELLFAACFFFCDHLLIGINCFLKKAVEFFLAGNENAFLSLIRMDPDKFNLTEYAILFFTFGFAVFGLNSVRQSSAYNPYSLDVYFNATLFGLLILFFFELYLGSYIANLHALQYTSLFLLIVLSIFFDFFVFIGHSQKNIEEMMGHRLYKMYKTEGKKRESDNEDASGKNHYSQDILKWKVLVDEIEVWSKCILGPNNLREKGSKAQVKHFVKAVSAFVKECEKTSNTINLIMFAFGYVSLAAENTLEPQLNRTLFCDMLSELGDKIDEEKWYCFLDGALLARIQAIGEAWRVEERNIPRDVIEEIIWDMDNSIHKKHKNTKAPSEEKISENLLRNRKRFWWSLTLVFAARVGIKNHKDGLYDRLKDKETNQIFKWQVATVLDSWGSVKMGPYTTDLLDDFFKAIAYPNDRAYNIAII